jgi:hypothetical protein
MIASRKFKLTPDMVEAISEGWGGKAPKKPDPPDDDSEPRDTAILKGKRQEVKEYYYIFIIRFASFVSPVFPSSHPS